MRRWNGWGDEAHDFPLKPKGLALLESLLAGKGPRLPDVALSEVLTRVPR